MVCSICRDLELAYEAGLNEYTEACSSACYRASKKHAAKKNVDMGRAKYALEEHRLLCVSVARAIALLPKTGLSTTLSQLAAAK